MKVYQDIVSCEEIISDSFKFQKFFKDTIVKCKSEKVDINGAPIDIGAGNAFGGAGEDEQAADMGDTVNNVLDAFKYQETSFDLKAYSLYIKGFMKRVKTYLEEHNPDRVADFMAGAREAFNWIKTNFDEFQFYLPESYDTENTIILAYYEEGDVTPTFVYWLDGLKGVTVWSYTILLPNRYSYDHKHIIKNNYYKAMMNSNF